MFKAKLTFLILFFIFIFSPLSFANTNKNLENNQTQWVWISSDNKYGKYYAPERIYIVSKKDNIPVCIDAWIKTTYTPAGAIETVPAMGLSKQIPDATKLAYSLAHVRIDPQGRTLEYLQEIFYDKNGTPLVNNLYDTPHVKEINSQAFDENFYDAIVDHIFNKKETEQAKSDKRWLSLWRIVNPQTTFSASADTTTIRKRGNDLIVWIWSETRENAGGKVIEIKFYKEVFNLVTYNYKIIQSSIWTPTKGWQKNNNLDGLYMPIVPDTVQDIAYHVLQKYASENKDWVERYQLSNAVKKTNNSGFILSNNLINVLPIQSEKKNIIKSLSSEIVSQQVKNSSTKKNELPAQPKSNKIENSSKKETKNKISPTTKKAKETTTKAEPKTNEVTPIYSFTRNTTNAPIRHKL